MRNRKFSFRWILLLAIIAMTMANKPVAAQQEEVLYNFTVYGQYDGGSYAALTSDANGNLYGTTYLGGTSNCGRVFELSPQANGGWIRKVLHNFNGPDGCAPYSKVIFDVAGNLYGTTFYGGNTTNCSQFGCGTVFELKPGADGNWSEKILHTFNHNGIDGYNPEAGLTFDSAGNLYGTTPLGGPNGAVGIVFELSPQSGGGWIEKTLYGFPEVGVNGAYPVTGVVFDEAGNIFGTTAHGGTNDNNYGVVFELTPKTGGWTEKVLYSFSNGPNGNGPSTLIFDASGNLYGTTGAGGTGPCNFEGIVGCGTVFELSPANGGGWKETILYNFGNGTDGKYPNSTPIWDASGNLYGTTTSGGTNLDCYIENLPLGCGTVFELTPQAGGGWAENNLHSFGYGYDGIYPEAGVILDAAGNIYGTTYTGGTYEGGVVFEVSP